MGIWIRSQDKTTLAYCYELGTTNYGRIWAESSNAKETYVFGEYESKVEALQVLDDIQNHINYHADNQEPARVFRMPEAGFSAQPEKFNPDCGSVFCSSINPASTNIIPPGDRCDASAECRAAWDRGCR